ncbi:MAG TPA: trimethylamine methyltransferase family protein [Candidatus Glassbacteria bacterium]|nr:trimethylamine methyltransferase family protein [Candidatus Glassbacteria bacterium]
MFSSVLTASQIERIHQASLEILERVGVILPHAEVLRRFADTGNRVDFASRRVWIGPNTVLKSVETAGKQFTLYGRDTDRQAVFGAGRRNYNSIGGEAYWQDDPDSDRRFCTLEDVATAARFCEQLDAINIAGAMSDPHEIPIEARCVEVLATLVRNTTKPVILWFHDRKSARYIVELLTALRGSEEAARRYPVCFPFMEPISPLRFPFNGVDLLFETSRLDLPVPIGPMAQLGLSAPASIAGTLAQENAEILAGICITQLVKEGLPVCYGGICHAFDMSTTQMIFSGPEQAIFGVAMTQIGKYYGLPVYINVGLTDAKRPDAQAGLEAGVTLALGAAAGADIFGHLGICGVDQASSLDMLVLQAEVVGYVESLLRELDFSDEALGIDVLAEVGPGGTFIDTLHTVERFRRELWFPSLLDRQYFKAWLENGAESTETRCRRRKAELLSAAGPEPLDKTIDREFDKIIRAARSELTGES